MSSPQDLELQEKIRVLVQAVLADQSAAPGIFRKLCRLCRAANMKPEAFRKRLVEAGLRAERASEIKTVLACKDWAEKFTAARSTVTWQEALAEARNDRMSLQDRRVAELCGYMIRNEVVEVVNQYGTFRLLPKPYEFGESSSQKQTE